MAFDGELFAERFEIQGLLGRGGVGEVHRAKDTHTGRTVALKCLLPKYATDARIRRRFLREARAFRRLRHPHIVEMYVSGEGDNKLPFISMELVPGNTLASLRGVPQPLKFIARTGIQILSALGYCHGQGIVHRDVKPENIVVCDDGRLTSHVKLLDFGFARIADDGAIEESEAFGTPLYMAPEQVSQDGPVGAAADIYSMGIILYEMLTGQPPFVGSHGMAVALMHLMESVPPLISHLNDPIPAALEAVIMKSLAKEPNRRFRSALEMARALAVATNETDMLKEDSGTSVHVERAASHVVNVLGGLDAFDAGAPSNDTSENAILLDGSLSVERMVTGQLVGRTDEQKWLATHSEELCLRHKGVVLLLEAKQGMGRRRLLRWLQESLRRDGRPLLLELGHRRHAGQEQGGLRQLILNLLQMYPARDGELAGVLRESILSWRALSDGLGDRLLHPRYLVALTKYLGNEEAASARMVSAEVDLGDEISLDALLAELVALAALDRPIVLTVGELLRAGEETVGFLRHLACLIEESASPIMLVVSYTLVDELEFDTTFVFDAVQSLREAAPNVIEIRRLEPILGPEMEALLSQFAPLDEAVSEAVSNVTGGNPFYATELVQLLHLEGALVEKGGVLTIPSGQSWTAWPRTLEETLRRRAESTLLKVEASGMAYEMLMSAAILGEAFDFDLLIRFLRRIVADDTDVERYVELFIDVNLMHEPVGLNEDRLHFSHALLRKALLAEMESLPNYGELCLLGAQAYVDFYQADISSYLEVVAGLFERGGRPLEAAQYWWRSGGMSRRDGHVESARERFETAERILSRSNGLGVQADRLRAEVWLELGATELRVDNIRRARNLAAEVYNWSQLNDESYFAGRALLLLGDALRKGGQKANAGRSYGKAVESFSAVGQQAGIIRALLGQAAVERDQGQLELALSRYEACEGLNTSDDLEAYARVLRGKGEVYLRLGRLGEARQALSRSAEHFIKVGDPISANIAELAVGGILVDEGESEDAITVLKRVINHASRLRQVDIAARAHERLGQVCRAVDEIFGALHHFEAACSAYDQLGLESEAAQARLNCGRIHLRRGEYLKAFDQLALGLPSSTTGVDAIVRRAQLCWAALEIGEAEAALSMLKEIFAGNAWRTVIDDEFAAALHGIGVKLLTIGHRHRARPLLDHADAIKASLTRMSGGSK